MSTLSGRFDRMAGKVTIDKTAKIGSLEAKIDLASLDTGDAKHEPGSYAAKVYGPRSRDDICARRAYSTPQNSAT